MKPSLGLQTSRWIWSANGISISNNVPGETTAILGTDIEYSQDDDPSLNREVALWEQIDVYEAVGVENTALTWGGTASISGSLSYSQTESWNISVAGGAPIQVSPTVGRSQTAGVSANYSDSKSGTSNEKWKTELYVDHRKYIKVITQQYKDQNGNWVFSTNSTTSILADGDVLGQFAYLHSVSTWKDTDATT